MLSPALYRSGGWLAGIATRMLAGSDGQIESLPPPLNAWTKQRDFPAFAKQSFRERLKKRRANRQGRTDA